MPIIANTTIISNFSAVDQLDLLRQSWPDLNITEQVFAEVQAGFAQGFRYYANIEQLIYPLAETGWLRLTSLQTSDEFRLYGQLLNNLHHGEASCLAIAYHRQWTFLSDDRAARLASNRLQIPFSGTIGTLIRLVSQDVIAMKQADQLLAAMIAKGYYSPVMSLQELMK